jgi:hypothetical protein
VVAQHDADPRARSTMARLLEPVVAHARACRRRLK